ncbi:MAG: acyltransferase [Cetobacterium sp.]
MFLIKQLIFHYLLNNFINIIPFYFIRNIFYKLSGIKIGKKSTIHMKTFVEGIYSFGNRAKIGDYTSIGRSSYLDCRGGIEIGNSVSISPGVQIITAQHELNSKCFKGVRFKVIIEDYAWIGTNAIILPGVKIGRGAVVAAGAVVTKNVESYEVVGGNPAKFIKNRVRNLDYKCIYDVYFD